MTQFTKDLIYSIAAGSTIDSEEAFTQAMAEILGDKLESHKIQVAKNFFKEPEASETDEEQEA